PVARADARRVASTARGARAASHRRRDQGSDPRDRRQPRARGEAARRSKDDALPQARALRDPMGRCSLVVARERRPSRKRVGSSTAIPSALPARLPLRPAPASSSESRLLALVVRPPPTRDVALLVGEIRVGLALEAIEKRGAENDTQGKRIAKAAELDARPATAEDQAGGDVVEVEAPHPLHEVVEAVIRLIATDDVVVERQRVDLVEARRLLARDVA